MIYNYGGKTQIDIQFDSITINDNEYIVPSEVANALNNYSERLANEIARHEADVIRYEELNAEKYDDIADRILLALAEGVNRDSLLAKSLDYYEKVDPVTCEPIFEFRHEGHDRIVLALKNIQPNGKKFTKRTAHL